MPPSDPLDLLSDVEVEYKDLHGRKMSRILTFRELAELCKIEMAVWDGLSSRLRFENQKSNDPAWKPIRAGEGQRKYRRWRG